MAKEYIEREKALNDDRWNSVILSHDRERAREIILCQPTADVVEVVRCKDCIYNANGCCTKSEWYDDTRYRPDYFCADGERRTDDGNKENL